MAKEETPYWVQLERQIKSLEDNFDQKGIEIALLQSEITDLKEPTALLNRLMMLHLNMFSEITEYLAKNKATERVLASKERLLELIDITTRLNGINDRSVSLKALNKELVGKMQLLRVENFNLRQQLNKITESDKF